MEEGRGKGRRKREEGRIATSFLSTLYSLLLLSLLPKACQMPSET
jgi:hypothetical protein